MARCIGGKNGTCEFYIPAEVTGDKPGCAADGDISDPEADIYCGEIDGDEE